MKQRGSMLKHKGFSLISMMLSVSIASVIMWMACDGYARVKHHVDEFRTQLAAEMELQVLATRIKISVMQAGFTPCRHLQHLIQVPGANLAAFTIADKTLTTQRMSAVYASVLNMAPRQLQVDHQPGFYRQEEVLVADCTHVEVASIAHVGVEHAKIWLLLAKPLAFQYEPPIFVGEWMHETYRAQASSGDLSVYYQFHQRDEVSKHINNIQILAQQLGRWTALHIALSTQARSLSFVARVRG